MKKTLSLLLSLALVLSLVPALGITAGATGKPSVTYRYYDTDAKEFKENTVSEYTLIAEDASTLVTWTAGTYVVGKDYNEDGVIDSADVTYAKAQEPKLPFTFTYSAGAKVKAM